MQVNEPRVRVITAIDVATGRESVTCPHCKSIILVTVNTFVMVCPNPTCRRELAISTPVFQRGPNQ